MGWTIFGGLFALGAYLAVALALQRRMLYPGARRQPSTLRAPNHTWEQTWLETESARVEAWLLSATNSSARKSSKQPAILFAHGNGEYIDNWIDGFDDARAAGFAVLLVEYPGFGRSEGNPNQQSIKQVMISAYDWLVAHPQIDSTKIVGHGRSLGGGALCTIINERPFAAIFLESTFSSVRRFTRKFGLIGPLTLDPFENWRALARFQGPILIVHGTSDAVVPFTHAQILQRHGESAQLITMDCGHSDCGPHWKTLETFLREEGVI